MLFKEIGIPLLQKDKPVHFIWLVQATELHTKNQSFYTGKQQDYTLTLHHGILPNICS
jgi:hypothetical protein